MLLPGEYFRCVKKDDDVVVGTLVYVLAIAEKEVEFGSGETTYTSDIDEFLKNFVYEPDGRKIRQKEIAELVDNIDVFHAESEKLLTDISKDDGPSSSTEMVVADQWNLKTEGLNKAKIQLQKIQSNMLVKQEKLEGLLAEKKAAFEHSLAKFQEKAQQLQEIIWSLNLYLGIGEQVIQLRDGERCLPTEMVRIRQKLLFMDEECAVAAETGGIDFQKIEEFDKWVITKDHLDQLLPEKKGVVALRVRRNEKQYGDPWMDDVFNKENMRTYFLIRNGECIWRIYAPINAGEVLFPRSDEFDEYYYHQWFGEEKKPIRPGSFEFGKAMKAADAKRRHYLRIMLVLQGLFDRTEVFAPFEGDRVNICDKRESERVLEFIKDDENLLGDGKPPFWTWVKELNSKIQVGHRVIGIWDNWTYGITRRGEHRITPRTACAPKDNQLYTIEEKTDDGFLIRYERNEDIYVRSGTNYYGDFRKPKIRATCQIERDDKCFIAFDLATHEDMYYYLTSRIHRHEYMALVPLLKRCMELKEQEKKTEAPFRKLLIGMIANKYAVEIASVEKDIDECIRHYKFKYKTHRALTRDDKDAIKSIISDYGNRLSQMKVRAMLRLGRTGVADKIRTELNKDEGITTIYIGHKCNKLYVSYQAMNEENVWVCEKTWKVRQDDSVTLVKSRAWVIVDKRHERWQILDKDERWDTWQVNPRLNNVFTDSERERIREMVFAKLADNPHPRSDNDKKKRFLPLAVSWDSKEGHMEVHWSSSKSILDYAPEFVSARIKLFRHVPFPLSISKEGGLSYKIQNWSHFCGFDGDIDQWIIGDKKKYYRDHGVIFWRNDENLAIFRAEKAEHDKIAEKQSEIYEKTCALFHMIEEQMIYRHMALEFQKFTKTNHESLWKDHKDKVKPRFNLDWFERRVSFLVEKGHELAGKSVQEALDTCAKLGYKDRKKDIENDDVARTDVPRELLFVEVKEDARESAV